MLLKPTTRQRAALAQLLEAQRELYNAALEERIGAWRYERRNVSRFEQFRELTGWNHPMLSFGVCPARGTLTRLDRAFQAFYRRCSRGEKPGYPRFKGPHRFSSVEYPDISSWRLEVRRDGVGRLHLKGIGVIPFRGSKRGVRGEPRTITIRREGSRWRVSVFCANVPANPRPVTGRQAGIDVGVRSLVATSDGELHVNPRFMRHSRQRLLRSQRLFAGRRPGSNRRRKAAASLGRLHRHVSRQRRNHHHELSRRFVDSYDVIVHEDLTIANLVRRPAPLPDGQGRFEPNGATAKGALTREISDAGWSQLLRLIAYKAEEAGREVIAVDPRRTSQTCHGCGNVDSRSRLGEVDDCRQCGRVANADINAAQNILRAGQALRHAREATRNVA